MKLLNTLAIAVAMIVVSTATSSAEAQQLDNGYRFGVGLNYARGLNFRTHRALGFRNFGVVTSTPRIDEPPYFAKFPPVYYNGIVRRPYGISPYAAPPGITPVEMTVAPPVVSKKITNPYFNKPMAPASDQNTKKEKKSDKSQNKVTWQINPHMDPVVSN